MTRPIPSPLHYSVRPGKQPSVSAPIQWDELDLKLKPTDFTIDTMPARLLDVGDLWKDIFNKKNQQQNNKVLKKLLGDN